MNQTTEDLTNQEIVRSIGSLDQWIAFRNKYSKLLPK